VPSHHIYGFIYNVLIPRILSAPCSERRFTAAVTLAGELAPGDLVIGTPFTWKLLAEYAPRLPHGIEGVTSTAQCPADVMTAVLEKGLEKMAEIYGSSESGAMGYRLLTDMPLTLSPLWERIEEDTFARRFPDGSLSQPFSFQDDLEWLDAKTFRVLKRIDRAVQIAGINVYPDRIAEVIRSCDLVADCAVRLMRPDEGNRLKAYIVLARDNLPTVNIRESLRKFLKERLNHLEQPKSLSFGLDLPRNEIGKSADW
jgi:long-chain acyl-CoA synthetase